MRDENTPAVMRPEASGGARDRIKSVSELADIALRARTEGKTVVLAHSVFDLLHLGHVRHLEAARRLGDVLIVTVTGDEFVRKGPGRPVFAQTMRAEMLAALDYVNWTGINRAATADPLIEAIQPDVYVKGSDYSDPTLDVTSNITHERELTEKYGGRLHFTDEVTFSSSGLINEYFEIHDPEARAFINDLRRNGGADRTLEMIDRLSDLRVLIVGETIMDEYDYVEALGKSSKENIIATLYQDREVFAGGVMAAANHIAGFCKEVEVRHLSRYSPRARRFKARPPSLEHYVNGQLQRSAPDNSQATVRRKKRLLENCSKCTTWTIVRLIMKRARMSPITLPDAAASTTWSSYVISGMG